MICDNCPSPVLPTTNPASSIRIVALNRPPLTEYFITAVPSERTPVAVLLAEIAAVLHDRNAQIVAQDMFASVDAAETIGTIAEQTLGQPRWPVTWIDPGKGQKFAGTQIWAVSGTVVTRLLHEGDVTGSLFEDPYATYCRLGGIVPTCLSPDRGGQADAVLKQMEATLSAGHMHFTDTVRTWFYLDDILSWYGDFNRARDAFFRDHNIFNGLVPASTGIGAANVSRSALVAGLLAARPKNGCVTASPVPSPLQCPAIDYGSSFSRAVEIDLPDHRRLYISGTASIAPDGRTIHVGSAPAQITKTMAVVAAILESRGMQWTDVVRGIAYVKNVGDIPLYTSYCQARGLPLLPVVVMNSIICRGDLLFELEVDALKKKSCNHSTG